MKYKIYGGLLIFGVIAFMIGTWYIARIFNYNWGYESFVKDTSVEVVCQLGKQGVIEKGPNFNTVCE